MNRIRQENRVSVIKSAISGNEEAFNQIFTNYHDQVFFIAMEFFHNEELSKDIVQDTFIYVHKGIKNLKNPKTFRVWLNKIAYNKCIDKLRTQKIKVVDLGDTMTIDDFSKEEVDEIDIHQQNQIKTVVVDTLEKLPFELRTVGMLRFYEDLKVSDISKILNIPVGTVTSRISKLKKILKTELKNNGITPSVFRVQLITPALLTESYLLLSNRYVMDKEISDFVYNSIVTKSALITGSATAITVTSSALVGKVAIALTTVSLFVGGGVAISQTQKDNTVNKATSSTNETVVTDAKIASIDYPKEWVNHEIKLNIVVSGDNYDAVLVNGQSNMTISKNGEYKIQLMKDDKVIDEQTITINNIDITAPSELKFDSDDNNRCVMYLNDDLSGINPNKILNYVDGVESHDFTYNPTDNTIVFTYKENTKNEFYIYDNAGNKLYEYTENE